MSTPSSRPDETSGNTTPMASQQTSRVRGVDARKARQLEHFRRAREVIDHAPLLTPEEQAVFASQCAQKDHEAWLRIHPELAMPELPLGKAA